MKDYFFYSFFILFTSFSFAQVNTDIEKPPIFPKCETVEAKELQNCFDQTVFDLVFNTYKEPQIVKEKNYIGELVVLFEVSKEGDFKVMYVDAIYKELKEEAKRVFKDFPKIKPGTYNGIPTFKQYSITIQIPLQQQNVKTIDLSKQENELSELENAAKNEFDSVTKSLKPYKNLEYKSQVNIPFTHSYYAKFDKNINLVGTNSHTASKPYSYNTVSKYYDFEKEKEALQKGSQGWWSRKLFNQHLVQVASDKYWFTIDPILDLQVGKDFDADFNSTYNNTRGLLLQGSLGKKLSFSASVFESQGRFAQYYNEYAASIKAQEGDGGIVPGRGIAKLFRTNSFDYPVAEGYLSYSPSDAINIQFGHGKNFIGDGYRSLFVSDAASPYPFLKLNTKFWKIQYTNTWMVLKDVRPDVTVDGAFLTKYMANHFLSWNVSKRINLGFFESVIWANTNDRGFDLNYLNPVIFYRAIEFETGQDAGNAIIGLSGKYKWNDNLNFYSQLIIDEFSSSDIFGGEKSWKNKLGFQFGIKYYNAFKLKNLMLQVEYNQVRPYTYSHNTITLNYGHNNQSVAHLWGSNFREFALIGHYHYKRWFADAKLIIGERGFDFNTTTDTFAYGGDIYTSEVNRPFETGVEIGQGNKASSIFGNIEAGYLVNTATNLKLFSNLTYRNFDPNTTTTQVVKSNTVWFNIGLRTDLFNWYFDY